MSERDQREVVDDAFAGFAAAMASEVRGVDVQAVHHAVVRKRFKLAAVGVLAVLAVALPAAVFAMGRANHGPPTGAVPADDRLSLSELRNLVEPDRVCPPESPAPHVLQIAHANLDADAGPETAAMIYCVKARLNGEPDSRVFVFERDPAGGLVTRGPIASGELNRQIVELGVHPAGGVVVGFSVPVGGVTEYDRYRWASGAEPLGFSVDRLTGLLTAEQLNASELEIPAWPTAVRACPSGLVRMPSAGDSLTLFVLGHVDIDGNGDLETLAGFRCSIEPHTAPQFQWLVYETYGAGSGVYVGRFPAAEMDAHGITDIRPAPDGRHVLGVISDTEARLYTWTGTAFEYVATVPI